MIWKKIKKGVQNLDAYQKVDEEYQEKTVFGGTVSLLCWVSIFLLCSLRTYEFITTDETEETIFVDTSRSPKLRINLDIVVNSISCGYLSLDSMDNSGERHQNIIHNIYKRRVDLSGNPIDEPKKENIGSDVVKSPKVTNNDTIINGTSLVKCGSCYGAENPKFNITCCNTCEEVRQAYRLMRWHLVETDVEQCSSLESVQEIAKATKEGCNIYGFVEVNRIGGSFHIAPGQTFTINHVHVHDVQPYSSSSFNTSHLIKHLTFGSYGENRLSDKIQDIVTINSLGGTKNIASEGATMFHYFIKIVPTLVKAGGVTMQMYQYSVTMHEKVVTPTSGESGMPGVFFTYEISALLHQITDKYVPWSHLAIDLCSIIGGIWIFSRFIDFVFYQSTKMLLHPKIDLGKAS